MARCALPGAPLYRAGVGAAACTGPCSCSPLLLAPPPQAPAPGCSSSRASRPRPRSAAVPPPLAPCCSGCRNRGRVASPTEGLGHRAAATGPVWPRSRARGHAPGTQLSVWQVVCACQSLSQQRQTQQTRPQPERLTGGSPKAQGRQLESGAGVGVGRQLLGLPPSGSRRRRCPLPLGSSHLLVER